MVNGQWYPPEWPARIRALADGGLTPVTPRRAATVMLLKDLRETPSRAPGRPGPASDHSVSVAAGSGSASGRPGPVVHMLRRHTTMAFAGGAYAYPGGGVDPRDADPALRWAGPSREAWATRLGVDGPTAQAIVCAAVRETFEESGVLLAGDSPRTVVGDTTADDWEADREALVGRAHTFAEFLRKRGLVLRSDLLAPWTRWITPEFEPRRYDTWFFVAALPEGQRTRDVSTEADRTVWIRPEDAAAGYDRGEFLMMPPTVATLRQLQPYATAADVLAAAPDRDLSPVLAKARLGEDGELVLSWPGHDEFTKHIAAPAAGRPAAHTAPLTPEDPV